MKYFPNLFLEHVPRELNVTCDQACQEAARIFLEMPIEVHGYIASFEQEIDNLSCEICQQPNLDAQLLLCDLCGSGFHLYCLRKADLPGGPFYCEDCENLIITLNAEGIPDLDPTINIELLDFLQGETNEASSEI